MPAKPSVAATDQLLAFRWVKAREALDRLAEVENDPFDDVMLEYVQPRTGAPVFPMPRGLLADDSPGIRDASSPAQQQRGLFCARRIRRDRDKRHSLRVVEGRRVGDCPISGAQAQQHEQLSRQSCLRCRTAPC